MCAEVERERLENYFPSGRRRRRAAHARESDMCQKRNYKRKSLYNIIELTQKS